MRSAWVRTLPLLLALGLVCAAAQNRRPVETAADYARAVRYLPFRVDPLVYGLSLAPHWMADGRFWYRERTPRGETYTLVSPATGARKPAFDARRLAAALGRAAHRRVAAQNLPIHDLVFSPGGRTLLLTAFRRRWRCDRQRSACVLEGAPPPGDVLPRHGPPLALSPNRKLGVFIRDYNLWLRNLVTGQVTQLTHSGVKNFGYATDNAGWRASNRAIVLWSPHSTKIATFQQDQRRVGKMYLVPVVVGHPQLVTERYPLPGDPTIITIQRVIIDLDAPGGPRVIRLQMPPDPHRSTLRDDLAFGPNEDVQWSPHAHHLAFISTSRDHKTEIVRLANASTGAVRNVYTETVSTEYEGGQGGGNFRYLPRHAQFLWYSHRPNWGQLYLYSMKTGRLIRQVTRGKGEVDSVVWLDRRARQVYFIATAKRPGVDPYYKQLYRVSLDHPGEQLLTPEDANHNIIFDPSGKYFVDTFSTPDTPPQTVLRRADGQLVARLQQADIRRLLATGWKPPTQVEVKARDGKTNLYGLMFTPFRLVPGKKYPIINHIYPGPQTGSVLTRNFLPAHGDDEAMAQLGFVVVELDGMGTPWRGQLFHMAYYGNMKDNTLPDQVAGMKQLARQYPFIDLKRAGIWGHSGGGDAAADAMFRYPNFFKVGVAESGNHDQREYEDDWGERYMGLDTPIGGGKTTYSGQDNQAVARNLKGHLLLAHGTMDNNVPMNNTLLLVQALIAANKNFDLILLPNQAHGYGVDQPYMMRRRWDYFVRYLMGARPPHEFRIEAPPE